MLSCDKLGAHSRERPDGGQTPPKFFTTTPTEKQCQRFLNYNSSENAYAISYPLTGLVVQYNGGLAKDATFTVTAAPLPAPARCTSVRR